MSSNIDVIIDTQYRYVTYLPNVWISNPNTCLQPVSKSAIVTKLLRKGESSWFPNGVILSHNIQSNLLSQHQDY